ncbi:acetamidase [Tricladium varicosporioides]|nr:acetamidase [Hymenoscyphus varicosporioides]
MGDITTSIHTPSWESTVKRKRAIRTAAIAPYIEHGIIFPDPLTDIDDIEELAGFMARGEKSVEQVILSYISKAVAAHETTNCLTEVNFKSALERARSLDEYFKTNGKTIGPLHGIPITLKDQFNVKGLDSTIGYVGGAFKPAQDDALVVKILQDLGAVVMAKTNLPQSIMWCETDNPLFGLTTHPRNPLFTPGGSTGGEGALLSLHGSLVGWGTDIGGSIRIPSSINGLYGLKPCSARLPYQGVPVSTDGQEHVPSSIGPMTRSLSSLTHITRSVISSSPWIHDPRVVPIPWREDMYTEIQSRPLVIGVLYDDNVVHPHPPITRVLKEAVMQLEAAGHEIVEWEPSLHKECIAIMDQFYTADGGEDIRNSIAIGGEPYIPHVEALVNRGAPISVYAYWQLNKQKFAAQTAYLEKWNNIKSKSGKMVDILLMPVMPHVAVPHRTTRWVGYTKVWNVLDYTAMSFPAGVVSSSKDPVEETYKPRSDLDAFNTSLYDPSSMDGYSVGLQIVGRRFEEEKVLGAAKVIEGVLKKDKQL